MITIPDDWILAISRNQCSLDHLADFLDEQNHPWTEMLRKLAIDDVWTVEVPVSKENFISDNDNGKALGDKLLPFGGWIRRERAFPGRPGLVVRQTICGKDFINWCKKEAGKICIYIKIDSLSGI